MQNTTNSLAGGLFAPMKMLLKIHRGIGIEMKKKLIIDYLENSNPFFPLTHLFL